jgi:hypothetical protein
VEWASMPACMPVTNGLAHSECHRMYACDVSHAWRGIVHYKANNNRRPVLKLF